MKTPLWSWLHMLLLISHTINFSVVVSQCVENQKSLLLQFKNNTQFSSSGKLAAWNQSTDCCGWSGVTCSAEGLVTGLDMSNESIYAGTANWSSLFNLHNLQTLDLSCNNFNSTIPPESDRLTSLKVLNLSYAGFTGQIPSSWKSLEYLVNLALGNNSLSGTIPDFLFSLPSLQMIDLSNNQFSGRLLVSNVSSSRLLNAVDLSSNELDGPLPISLFDLRGLKYLSLSSNSLSGSLQLDSLRHFVNLSYIDLSYNSLSVYGTDSRLSFPHLTTFRLASCKLTSFPEFLRNQSLLRHLDLSANQIQGTIPNWIWEIGLVHLSLSFNSLINLEAPIPNPISLSILDLHSNQLQGPIPILPESASYLDYSTNNLSSAIPSDIGSYLSSAMFFSLSSNNFHGDIPASICNASYLQVLDLSKNSLTGMIPDCLMSMSSTTLGVLNLGRNNLSGSIDDSFAHDCNLKIIDVSGNQLQGKVPKSLANCQSLELLNFGSNLMRDTFPCHLMSTSTSLRVLALRSNQFYGHIGCSGSEGDGQMLHFIDLASNSFDGTLPGKFLTSWRAMMFGKDFNSIKYELLGFTNMHYEAWVTIAYNGREVKTLTVFALVDFSCNQLQGPIPEEIGELKALQLLSLSHNALTGGIPEEIGELKWLQNLNLSHNALTGTIPSDLGNLSVLGALDLSANQLTGTIPRKLGRLDFLSFLNLSRNQLVGKIPTGSQLGTFEESSFEDNLALCGLPLKAACTYPERPSESPEEEGSGSIFDWQFMCGGVLGFGFGSGAVIGALLITKKGSELLDRFMDHIHFGILHPSWFIHTLLDRCASGTR